MAARDAAAAAGVAGRLGKAASWIAMDVADSASVEHALRHIGPVDILISSAGVLLDHGQPPTDVDLALVQRSLRTNALGALDIGQRIVPGMVDRGWGRVVMVSSGTGAFANGLSTQLPAYALSKVALNAVTVLLAAQTAGSGVLVNAVNPGMTRTRMCPGATQTPEQAAAQVVQAATLPDGGPTGVFLRRGQQIPW